jgi:MFS transporter, DHA3 family, macrolide efflux protein
MKNILLRISSHDFAVLLRDKPYVFFLLSVIFSQVAFNMMNVVLMFLIFNLTSSNFLVSIALFIALLPQVFLSFIGGVVADLRDKKDILLLGNVGRALVIILLFFFNSSIFWVYLLAFLVSVVTQFYIPAETPIIPKLVSEKLLIAANSLFGLALFGSILVGYVMAGPAYGLLGNSYVFFVLALLFASAGVFAYFIPSSKFKEEKEFTTRKKIRSQVEESLKSYFVETYKLLRQTKDVGPSFILLIVSQIVIFVLAIVVPGYAKNTLNINVENASLILFAPAALGMIVAAVAIGSFLKDSNRNKMMNTGVFLSGIVLLLLPTITSIPFVKNYILITVFIVSFFAGIANALIFIPSQTTIQEKIPENFRSKIYGLLFSLIGRFSLLPIVLVGGIADNLGVNFVLVAIALIILIGQTTQVIIFSTLKKN